jgi:hypothetical protein
MATVSIQKIQVRRGLAADLPGQPTSLSPLVFAPGLAVGEFGFTVDLMRLFLGVGLDASLSGMPQSGRRTFPYQNSETLTENSPLPTLFGGVFSDNQYAFRKSAPLIRSASFLNLQVPDALGVARDFYLDQSSSGGNAVLCYFLVSSTGLPLRSGRLTVLWTPSAAPLCTDEAQARLDSFLDVRFQTALTGAGADQHVVLQYTNVSDDSPIVAFDLRRPLNPPQAI